MNTKDTTRFTNHMDTTPKPIFLKINNWEPTVIRRNEAMNLFNADLVKRVEYGIAGIVLHT